EGVLKLGLPLRVGRVGAALQALAFGADAEHARGEGLDALFGAAAGFLPTAAAELAEGGRAAADADVATDLVRLGHRHEELGALGVVQHQHLLAAAAGAALLKAAVAGDAMLEVHDDVAGVQFAQDVARL